MNQHEVSDGVSTATRNDEDNATAGSADEDTGDLYCRLPTCAICLCSVEDAVVTSCGQIYDLECISQWLSKERRDPITREELQTKALLRLSRADLEHLPGNVLRHMVRTFWLDYEKNRLRQLPAEVASQLQKTTRVERGARTCNRLFEKMAIIAPEYAEFENCLFRDCNFDTLKRVSFKECRFEGNMIFWKDIIDTSFAYCSYGEIDAPYLFYAAIADRAQSTQRVTCISQRRLFVQEHAHGSLSRAASDADFFVKKLEYAVSLLQERGSPALPEDVKATYLYSLLQEKPPIALFLDTSIEIKAFLVYFSILLREDSLYAYLSRLAEFLDEPSSDAQQSLMNSGGECIAQ